MTGQINVNKIAARTGNTITINSGDKISGAAGAIAAPGQVIQVVNNHYIVIQSTSSTSLVATSVLANITPKFATSKILVDMRIQGLLLTAATSSVELALYNGTEGGPYSEVITWNQASGYTNASDERIYGGTSTFQYFHDVNNTNNNRYTVYFAVSGSGTVYYNNYRAGVNKTASSITLMEIAQ